MKIRSLAIFSALALFTISCEENINEGTVWDDPDFIRIKTSAQPLSVKGESFKYSWAENDSIFVYNEENKVSKLRTNDPSTNIFFSYEWAGGQPTWAIHPNIDGITFTPEHISGICVDSLQTISKLNAYGPMTFIGKTTGNRSAYKINSMKNVTGQIKLSLGISTATSIVVEAPGGELIAGNIGVNPTKLLDNTSDCISVVENEAGSSYIRIVPAEGSEAITEDGCLAAGSYYLTVIPQVYSRGLRITVNQKDAEPLYRNFRDDDGSLTVMRGEVREFEGNLNEVELPETFSLTFNFLVDGNKNWPFNEAITPTANQDVSKGVGETYTYTYKFEVDGTTFTRDLPFVFYGNKKTYGLGVNGLSMGTANSARITLPAIANRYLKSVTVDVTNAYAKGFSIVDLSKIAEDMVVAPTKPINGAPSTITFPFNGVVTATNTRYFLRFKDKSTNVKSITIVYTKEL